MAAILPSHDEPRTLPAPAPISLLTAQTCTDHVHLILGTNPLASSRVSHSISSGAKPVVVAPHDSEIHYALQRRIDEGDVQWHQKEFQEDNLFNLGRQEVGKVVDAVFITFAPRDAKHVKIAEICKRNRIPINVIDAPDLCTFTLLSVHSDGPLQIGVTTNGHGCKLSSRIRREIASSLPPSLGNAVTQIGRIRKLVQQGDGTIGDMDDSTGQGSSFNKLIKEGSDEEAKTRRVRWLSQVCEYWPLRKLASLTEEDVERVFASYTSSPSTKPPPSPPGSSLGRIILAGSGPGHPDLLTQATHKAIQAADIILADKLVPSGVLDLIPRRTPVSIAKKFPGNADAAQQELLDAGLAAYLAGRTVLRLKQGDPYIYGRGGEEYAFFRAHGVPNEKIVVLPGITSALSAPLFASVPSTQRDVADQVLICTGTGKKGKPPKPPPYVASQTVVFLMALHRIGGLVAELTSLLPATEVSEEEKPGRELWPLTTPCTVIERASCPDQRVIRTTLRHVVEAIDVEGSRPPGLLVVGRACEVLHKNEDRGRAWIVEEGFRGLDVGDTSALADLKELAALAS